MGEHAPRLTALVAEGAANVSAARRTSPLRVMASFAVGLAVAFLAASTAVGSVRAASGEVVAGRHMLRILGAANAPVTAASCESLKTVTGVVHAGGLHAEGVARLANGVEAPRFAVTAGFSALLRLDSSPAPSVVVGADLARRAGLRHGSVASLDHGPAEPVAVLPSDRRTADWSGALLAVDPPTGLVDECWVELDHPPSSADDPIFVLVDGPRPLVVGPFDQATLRPTPAETTAATLGPARIGLAGAVVLFVLTGGFWWAQREDRALYAALGFRPAHLSVIATTDWLLTCACPALVGATWGTLLALAPDRGAAGIGPAASATAVLLLGSSVTLVGLRASAQRIRTRQVLAGI